MNFFSNIYNVIFPALGFVFGFFTSLANMPFHSFLEFMFHIPDTGQVITLNCLNLITGDPFSVDSFALLFYDFLTTFDIFSQIPGLGDVIQNFSSFALDLPYDAMFLFSNSYFAMLNVPMTIDTWVAMIACAPLFAVSVGILSTMWNMIPIL